MKTATICLTMPKDLKEKIEKMAKDKSVSRNALIRIAISEYIKRSE